MKQQERQQKSREKILSAAMQEFAERGYEEVTVDSICQKYEISKGMLYHYYSGKDALFLLCVQHTFQQLEEYLLERMEQLEQKDPVEAMQEYFLLRESFFQENPQQKQIFEAALLRAPIQLTEQIEQIRQPLIRVNREFLHRTLLRLPLQKGLEQEEVLRYFCGVETVIWKLMEAYCPQVHMGDTHLLMQTVRRVIRMILFGVVTLPEGENRKSE